MKGRQSSKLFDESRPKKKVTWSTIPTFEASDLLPKSNMDGRSQAQQLYLLGASLINSGKSYSGSDNTISISDLMNQYNELPAFIAENGRHTANNPLHALFVIKVALDHIDESNIVIGYLRLKFAYTHKTIYNVPMSFPNGSTMFNDFATLQIMRAYILSQPHRFKFLSEADRGAVEDKSNTILSSYVFIVGQAKESNIGWDKVDEILSQNRHQPAHKESDGMRILSRMNPTRK